MTRLTSAFITASLLALTAGCGGGSATNNQTAAPSNVQSASGNAEREAMPSGPFSQAEMQMHERMMAAAGANASETWARKMVEHHRGAVAMSQILVDQGGEQRYVEMARMSAEKQRREIAELERMLVGDISGGSGEANPFGPVEQSMHEQMMAANGASLSETWARKMIAHHQGAVDMSEALIRQGGDPEVLAIARRTAEDQRREIAHLEAMLSGEAMPEGGAQAPAAAARDRAAPADRERSAAPRTGPAERPAQREQTAPRSAPKQSPAPAPAPTCLPEHRALGHC